MCLKKKKAALRCFMGMMFYCINNKNRLDVSAMFSADFSINAQQIYIQALECSSNECNMTKSQINVKTSVQ